MVYHAMPPHVSKIPAALVTVTGVWKMMIPKTIAMTCFAIPHTFTASGEFVLLALKDTMLSRNAPRPFARARAF
jgi:hypothetical protein